MADKLIIVESPGKVKTIGKFLGRGYKVDASMGHLRDLPKSTLGVDIEAGFEPKYINIRGRAELINKLRREAKGREVLLATDPDREGEAISWHLAHLLSIDEGKACRISFNEITKGAVTGAIKKPRKIDMDLVASQQARRVLDRIVGYKISPLLWKNVRKGLSAGRVQSVATRLVCDREDEVSGFTPEEYWVLKAWFDKGGKEFGARYHGTSGKKVDLARESQADAVVNDLSGAEYAVESVRKADKPKVPAAPFITSSLQQEASRKLGFTTKKTMMLAQQLYEGVEVGGEGTVGLITYMRTDSTRLSDEAVGELRDYIGTHYGPNYLPDARRVFKNRNSSQDAHEAIRPSNVAMDPKDVKESLTADQYRLYKLIWDRAVASQMSNALYEVTNVDILAKGKHLFKAMGSSLRFDGFMALYTEGRDEGGEAGEGGEHGDEGEHGGSGILQLLTEGERLDCKRLDKTQHFTQPPPRYTEASLVKALEEKGIGRPSTYSPTIITILSRGYVEKDRKYLIPTELGRIVTGIMKSHFPDIVDLGFTAAVERELDEVEEGKKGWAKVLGDFYESFKAAVESAESQIGKVSLPDEETGVPCEKCGRIMVVKVGRYGRFMACPGFPGCRNAKPIHEDAGIECAACGGRLQIRKSRKGRRYVGCENNPACDFMSWDMPSDERCPECGVTMLRKGSGRDSGPYCMNQKCAMCKYQPPKRPDGAEGGAKAEEGPGKGAGPSSAKSTKATKAAGPAKAAGPGKAAGPAKAKAPKAKAPKATGAGKARE
ncbi:MAG: type I DNA topoisomerase [Oscillospiraceae bacterium]|nr:type I DNA topoisomerase [Oscillospiraceae bacterium]